MEVVAGSGPARFIVVKETAALIKRLAFVGLVSIALVCLVYRGYIYVDEQPVSLSS